MCKRFREISVKEYQSLYARMGMTFDVYSGESMQQEGMKRAMVELTEKNILVRDQGALIVDLKVSILHIGYNSFWFIFE